MVGGLIGIERPSFVQV